MIPTDDARTPGFPDESGDDQIQLDRLVDGALEPAERAALLTRLDALPDGWRRCALAFLEAQVWREALGPIAKPEPAAVPVTAPPRPRRLGLRVLSSTATLAASLIAAFILGLAIGGGSEPASEGRPDLTGATVARNAERITPPRTSTPLPDSVAPSPANNAEPSAPPVFPEYVRASLERRGIQVEQRLGLVAVQGRDGRRVALPVNEVQLRYIGNRTY